MSQANPTAHNKKRTNYSYDTSLPAYQSNAQEKLVAEKQILAAFRSFPDGRGTLKQAADAVGLPQSTVSGRINDLIDKMELMDTGTKLKHDGYTRKVFAIIRPVPVNSTPPVQQPLFHLKKLVQ